MEYFRVDTMEQTGGVNVSTNCPHCSKSVTFNKTGVNDLLSNTHFFGHRICPNPDCLGHIFYVKARDLSQGGMLTYPFSKINFSKEGIPENIIRSFEEAIVCHSTSCYVASAIMLRKTLEEICHHQNAEGSNLFKRLESLASIITIPKELIEAMNELRLLGNDAAHLEKKIYEEIGEQEVEISIEFTKEILKAVYQYQSLIGKLRSLKKPQTNL